MTSEWTNVGEIDFPEGFYEALPSPVTWRLLVLPKSPETVSAGGIVLTSANQEAQMYNTYIGQVLKAGPLVGAREPISLETFPVAEGSWVLYGKYAGQRVEVMGIKLIFLNDEDILGITHNPQALKIAV